MSNELDKLGEIFQELLIILKPFLILWVIWVIVSILIDQNKDYSKKGVRNKKHHDPGDSGEKIIAKYWFWELKKKKYLESYYRNGRIIPFNGANYLVNHLYTKQRPRRRLFFLFGNYCKSIFRRRTVAYITIYI